jgi:hypothetical protein
MPQRDLRIDLIRGLALLTIFIDHNGWLAAQCRSTPGALEWIAAHTLRRYSFIDAADVFLLLSGYVSGLVYARVLLTKGLKACIRKALSRCYQLYFAEVSLCLACMFLVECVAPWDSRVPAFVLHHLHDKPLATIIGTLTLLHSPPILGFLPFYILLIGLTPFILYLWGRRPALVFMAAFCLYMSTQTFLRLPSYLNPDITTWLFNPFAAQAVFLLGLGAGYSKTRFPGTCWRPGPVTLSAAVFSLLLIAIVRLGPSELLAGAIHSHLLASLLPSDIPFTGKHNMEPIRLLNLLLWVIVLARASSASRLFDKFLIRIPVSCGQTSLIVYWVGVLLNYIAIVHITSSRGGYWLEIIWTFAGCAILAITPAVWVRLKTAGLDNYSVIHGKVFGLEPNEELRQDAPG